MAHRIGLISDTHGLLRPQVHDLLASVELILHAGDVGGEMILHELALIAPVEAVYGNTDRFDPILQQRIEHTFDGVRVLVTHGHELGRPKPEQLFATYDADVIVYGHTHRQVIAYEGDRMVINPGAAGPRRFELLPSVAILTIDQGRPFAELLPIE